MFCLIFALKPHMGNTARVDLKPPANCLDLSWPFPSTPSSKSLHTMYLGRVVVAQLKIVFFKMIGLKSV